ncbi:hypothetical protein DCO58_02530 [Helicobacter saguini]|uniref:hypothetical protein n=2 Tax=Helicobacter saguini TaxID=1548018 RepID=UPI00136F4640|nr:hypothetical protein [Helicobacter saguini]MWV66584.1 hypothetical protein [Helicobacter saguini]
MQDSKNSRSEKSQNATKTQNLNLENNQTKVNTRSVVGGFGGLQGGIRGSDFAIQAPLVPPCERVDSISKELSNNIKESSEFVNSRSETKNVENKKDSIKLVNLDSNNVNIPTPLAPLRKGGGNTITQDSKHNAVSLENKVSLENTESNSQNSKIVSKDSIKKIQADSKNLQNLDSIESNNLSPAHHPTLEKDSNQTPIESNKFENYQIYNFIHPNNQNFITFTMPSNATPPTQITYKTHFKLSFLLKLLQYYLTGIALFFLAKIAFNESKNTQKSKIYRILNLKNLAIALLLVAVFARFYEYINHKDLWLDEASLSYSMYGLAWSDMFLKALPNGQAAPVGFLVLSKIIGAPFNYNEYSLYFLPFISGLLVLFLTYKIAFLDSIKSSFFPAFFITLTCGSLGLLYYAAEFKQYEGEAAAAFLLVYLFLANKSFKSFIIATIFCSLFSYTSLFIAFGLGFGYLYRAIFQANFKQDSNLFIESNLQNSKDVTNVTSKDSMDVTFVTSKQNALNNDITESNLQDFQTDSKNSQNLDSIESNNLSPTHRPINHTKNVLNFFKQNALYIAILGIFVVAYYLLYIRYQAGEHFYNYWAKYFLPRNLSEYPEFIRTNLIGVYEGFSIFGVSGVKYFAFFLPLGLAFLYVKKRDLFIAFSMILCVYIALSLLRIYPFGHWGLIGGRLSLYMSVVFFILITYGALCFYQFRILRFLCNFSLLILMCFTAQKITKYVINKEYYFQQTHELIKLIDKDSKIYVYNPSTAAMSYYFYVDKTSFNYETFGVKIDDIPRDLESLKGKIMNLKRKDSKTKITFFASHYWNEQDKQLINLAKEFDKNPTIIQTKGAILITFQI